MLTMSQRNDWTPHDYQVAKDLVTLRYVGHPVDRPRDLRARPFWVEPNGPLPAALLERRFAVVRVVYKCLGSCETPAKADDDSSEKEDEEDGTDSDKKTSKPRR